MSCDKKYLATEEAQIGTPPKHIFHSNYLVNVDKSSESQQHGKRNVFQPYNLKVNNSIACQLKV